MGRNTLVWNQGTIDARLTNINILSKRPWLHPALQTLPAYAKINIGETA